MPEAERPILIIRCTLPSPYGRARGALALAECLYSESCANLQFFFDLQDNVVFISGFQSNP